MKLKLTIYLAALFALNGCTYHRISNGIYKKQIDELSITKYNVIDKEKIYKQIKCQKKNRIRYLKELHETYPELSKKLKSNSCFIIEQLETYCFCCQNGIQILCKDTVYSIRYKNEIKEIKKTKVDYGMNENVIYAIAIEMSKLEDINTWNSNPLWYGTDKSTSEHSSFITKIDSLKNLKTMYVCNWLEYWNIRLREKF